MFVYSDLIILLLIWSVLLWLCYTDICHRIIANRDILILLGLVVAWYLFGNGVINYMLAGLFLIIGLAIFYLRLAGAGDIKLITVLLLSLPTQEGGQFLVMMALCGLPLALFILLKKVITKKAKITLPYGVAISMGYLIVSAKFL